MKETEGVENQDTVSWIPRGEFQQVVSHVTCWRKIKKLEDWERLLDLRDINHFQEYYISEMVRVEVRLLRVIQSFAGEVHRQCLSFSNLRIMAKKGRC